MPQSKSIHLLDLLPIALDQFCQLYLVVSCSLLRLLPFVCSVNFSFTLCSTATMGNINNLFLKNAESTKPKVIDDRWAQCRIPNKFRLGTITKIDAHRFVYVSYRGLYPDPQDSKGIYIFDIRSKQWQLFMRYNDPKTKYYQCIFSPDTNDLYLIKGRNKITCINIKNKIYSTILVKNVSINMVCVKGEIYFIEKSSTKHYSFDINSEKTKLVHQFTEFSCIIYPTLIYVQSQDIILLMGGIGETISNADNNLNIWKFCLKTRKWSKIENIEFPYNYCKASLTKHEKYLIIVGSRNIPTKIQKRSGFMILDIGNENEYVLTQSKIQLPFAANCTFDMVITDGADGYADKIVSGFMRENRKYREMPYDIFGIICMFYGTELLHCITLHPEENRQHVFIPLSCILSERD